jgi:hypothetical protein
MLTDIWSISPHPLVCAEPTVLPDNPLLSAGLLLNSISENTDCNEVLKTVTAINEGQISIIQNHSENDLLETEA